MEVDRVAQGVDEGHGFSAASAGNVNDVTEAPRLVQAARGTYFIADQGYDSHAVAAAIEAKGMTVVIQTPADRSRRRKIDRHVYKERHLVENFFCRLKTLSPHATRFDKTAGNFLGFVLLASIRIWMAWLWGQALEDCARLKSIN